MQPLRDSSLLDKLHSVSESTCVVTTISKGIAAGFLHAEYTRHSSVCLRRLVQLDSSLLLF